MLKEIGVDPTALIRETIGTIDPPLALALQTDPPRTLPDALHGAAAQGGLFAIARGIEGKLDGRGAVVDTEDVSFHAKLESGWSRRFARAARKRAASAPKMMR